MRLKNILFLGYLIFLTQSINALGFRGIFCAAIGSYHFVRELFSVILDPDQKLIRNGVSTVELSGDQFIRKTIKDQNIFDEESINIDYASSLYGGLVISKMVMERAIRDLKIL